MRAGAGQFNMTQPFAAHAGKRYLHAALIADYSAMLHALILAAQTLPVRYRAEDAGAEQAVALGLERAVVDGFRLCDFAMRPAPDFFRRGQTDSDRIEVGNQIGSIVRRGTIHELSLNTFQTTSPFHIERWGASGSNRMLPSP